MPGFINQFPYTDFHELNLDYVLAITEENKQALETLTTYDNRLTQAENDIISLDGRLDSAENSISSLSTTVGNHTTALTSLGNRMLSAETDISNIELLIYQGRSESDNQPRVITRFTGGASISDVLDMPPWSFYLAVGPTMQPKLGADFTDTLSNIDYILTKRTYMNFSNGDAAIYDLVNPSGTQHWIGYKIAAYPYIQWSRIVTTSDTTLTLTGEAADAKTVGDAIYNGRDMADCQARVMTRYIRENTLTDCRDMPDWSYITMLGSAMQSILGSGFSDSLSSSVSYILKKTSVLGFNGSAYMYDLIRMNGTEHWIGYLATGMTDITWTRMPDNATYNTVINTISNINNEKEMFVWTSFETEVGFWTENSITNTYQHTKNIKVVPGQKLYRCYRVSQNVQGIWLDADQVRMSNLLDSDMTRVDYQTANGNNPDTQLNDSNYGPIWEFTVPANAYYLSLNVSTSASYKYREGLSTFPMLLHENTQNFSFSVKDPVYTSKNQKNLLVIGPSTAWIDRRWISALNQFISGFSEYLVPFYKSVTVWGFDGCPYGDADDANQTSYYQSIYKRIVTNQSDLTDFDEILLMGSSNLISLTGPGDYGDFWTVPADGHGYLSAIRGILHYIATDKPETKVYVCPITYNKKMHDNLTRSAVPDMEDPTTDGTIIYTINTFIRAMSSQISVDVIDLTKESGFTDDTYNTFTYDGTHWNQEGHERIGMILRKHMIGI